MLLSLSKIYSALAFAENEIMTTVSPTLTSQLTMSDADEKKLNAVATSSIHNRIMLNIEVDYV